MAMIDYLRTIFGEDIKQESFQYPAGTPNYIRNGYKAWCFSWDGQKCVVLKPVSASWRLPGVKKQFRNFKSLSDLPCVLCFDRLTSAQRKDLMQEKIPFVVAKSQLYMPFWGVHFVDSYDASQLEKAWWRRLNLSTIAVLFNDWRLGVLRCQLK